MTAIRLLLVDDDPLVRAGLSFMMGGADDIEIVGEAADGSEVAALVDRTRPDVVLMDIRMPNVDGLTATERAARHARTPRRSSSSPPSTPTTRCCGRCARARPGSFSRTPRRPRSSRRYDGSRPGDPVLSPTVTRQLMAHAAGSAARHPAARAPARRIATLNDREREVAVAVGQGRSNAEIATELFMSVATVKTHVSRILAKLDLNNRVQIALLTYDAGLLEEDGH